MIRSITLTVLLFGFVGLVYADISVEQIPISVRKTGEVINNDLSENEAVYIFNFSGLSESDSSIVIEYQIDGTPLNKALRQSQLRIETTPGAHSFQFNFLQNNIYKGYNNIVADSLIINSKMEASYQVQVVTNLTGIRPIGESIQIDTTVHIISTFCKPVIYLYPENTIDVKVSININGDRPFYYPAYDDNWCVTAHPNGDLEIDNEFYRYLFWEADDTDYLSELELNEGFVVEGSNAISFLESHLKTFGFTAAERADFITYWGPKLAANDQSLVRFEWNEACDKFADLNISPQPDHIYRFYIFMSALDADYVIQPQIIPTMNRDGFTVLEWGGQLSNFQPTKVL